MSITDSCRTRCDEQILSEAAQSRESVGTSGEFGIRPRRRARRDGCSLRSAILRADVCSQSFVASFFCEVGGGLAGEPWRTRGDDAHVGAGANE